MICREHQGVVPMALKHTSACAFTNVLARWALKALSMKIEFLLIVPYAPLGAQHR